MKIDIEKIATAFVGLDTRYPLADGTTRRRVYLDSSASTLMLRPALEALERYLPHYANTHTTVHTAARITAEAVEWAQQAVLRFLGAEGDDYLATFPGHGATAAINRAAAGLAALRPEREVVLVSAMEHHSNDLPHRAHAKTVEHIPLRGEGAHPGAIDLEALEALLERHGERVNYVAVTGVSNVTGILNPLEEIARLAHRHGAYLLVDGAQMTAHAPARVAARGIDLYAFSGHKVYAPGAPGVLVGRREILAAMPPLQLGGGMVEAVSAWGFEVAGSPQEKEQAGTPPITGIILLGCALEVLRAVGMEAIFEHERALTAQAMARLGEVPGLTLYGEREQSGRIGALAFNLEGIGHGLVAAILNDYHAIAVRNECFCAHPYVQQMLAEEFGRLDLEGLGNEEMNRLFRDRRGMVRASFGLYTTGADIEALAAALHDIATTIDRYRPLYRGHEDGSYSHRHFRIPPRALFDPEQALEEALGRL